MNGDESLLERAAEGDGDAFAQLVSPHRAELLGFARRILAGDGQAGEEVVQEALLNAYRALVRGARPDSIRPWLFVIVRNCALNARRQAQTTYALGDGDGSRSGDAPNEAAEQGEWIDWLMGAIGELPPRQRQAIVGRELEGRSHVELASSLGTTVLAVKTLLHRARARLRALRAESMLSVPVFLKGRVAAGVKAGGGVLGQSLAAASVTTLVVLAVHGGGAAPVGAAGLTVHGSRASAARRSGGATRSTADRPPSALQVRREATRAIAGCVHGRPLKGFSQQALNYAAGHLSADELEYTDCEARLRRAARAGAVPPRATARGPSTSPTACGGQRRRRAPRPPARAARDGGDLPPRLARHRPAVVRLGPRPPTPPVGASRARRTSRPPANRTAPATRSRGPGQRRPVEPGTVSRAHRLSLLSRHRPGQRPGRSQRRGRLLDRRADPARHPAVAGLTPARSRASSSRRRRVPPGPAPMRPVAW